MQRLRLEFCSPVLPPIERRHGTPTCPVPVQSEIVASRFLPIKSFGRKFGAEEVSLNDQKKPQRAQCQLNVRRSETLTTDRLRMSSRDIRKPLTLEYCLVAVFV